MSISLKEFDFPVKDSHTPGGSEIPRYASDQYRRCFTELPRKRAEVNGEPARLR